MTEQTALVTAPTRPTLLQRIARRGVLSRLARIRHGLLVVTENGREHRFGDAAAGAADPATVTIEDPRAWTGIAFGGSLGAAEGYIDGHWRSRALVDVIRVLLRNSDVLEGLDAGSDLVSRPLQALTLHRSRNTHGGARRNISAHYDLGNAFFRLFLDDTLSYSSAVYPRADATLDEAALHKLDVVCRRLQLGPRDHLLEIGTGWGGLAIHAARHYGCRVTTTTISREQYELAARRVAAAGLEDRIELLDCDYRELEGRYDKLVSVEMIEAVGHEYFDEFFRRCSALLRDDGLMFLQAITIADQHYERTRRSVDFIKRHIFPGGCLPSVAAMADCVARVTDLNFLHLEDIGHHYAGTLQDWRTRFTARIPEVRKLGYDERFLRMWEYYLCYCQGGFEHRTIGTAQILLGKPAWRPAPAGGHPA